MITPEPQATQQVILDSITDRVFTIDSQWRITSFNRADVGSGKARQRNWHGGPV